MSWWLGIQTDEGLIWLAPWLAVPLMTHWQQTMRVVRR